MTTHTTITTWLGSEETIGAVYTRTDQTLTLSLKIGDARIMIHAETPDDLRTPYLEMLWDGICDAQREHECAEGDRYIAQLDKRREWPMAENE